MHFSAAATTAAIIFIPSSTLATPMAIPSSHVPTVAPNSIILGEILLETESAAKNAELAAAGITVNKSTLVFTAGDADAEGAPGKRSYLGSCDNCRIATINGEYALECRCRNSGGAWG